MCQRAVTSVHLPKQHKNPREGTASPYVLHCNQPDLAVVLDRKHPDELRKQAAPDDRASHLTHVLDILVEYAQDEDVLVALQRLDDVLAIVSDEQLAATRARIPDRLCRLERLTKRLWSQNGSGESAATAMDWVLVRS